MVTPAAAGRAALRGLRTLAADLTSTARLPQLPGRAGWVAQGLVIAVAVTLGAVAGRVAAEAGVRPGIAVGLGAAQALPLLVALVRPLAGAWLSLLVGVVVSETVRAGGPGPVWAEPSLLVHLGVLGLVALVARPRVLAELWVLTLLAGVVLVQRMPGLDASPDLAEMTSLSAVVLLAVGAVRGRGEARRHLAEQERISEAERARRTLLEERARIARELHDVVAHHMSVIAIQAEAAPYRVQDPPEELTGSFATIRARTRSRPSPSCAASWACCAPTELGRRRRAAAHPRPAGRPGRQRARRRADGRRQRRSARPARAARRGGAVGVPDRAGGAEQRPAARARREVRVELAYRPGGLGCGSSTARRRAAGRALAGRRPRRAGHAGAGGDAGRRADRRPAPGRRLRGGGGPAGRRGRRHA